MKRMNMSGVPRPLVSPDLSSTSEVQPMKLPRFEIVRLETEVAEARLLAGA